MVLLVVKFIEKYILKTERKLKSIEESRVVAWCDAHWLLFLFGYLLVILTICLSKNAFQDNDIKWGVYIISLIKTNSLLNVLTFGSVLCLGGRLILRMSTRSLSWYLLLLLSACFYCLECVHIWEPMFLIKTEFGLDNLTLLFVIILLCIEAFKLFVMIFLPCQTPQPYKETGKVFNGKDNHPRIDVGCVDFSETIVDMIGLETMSSESVAIGVSGPWGSGKTTFMTELKHQLNRRGFVVIEDFHPWQCADNEQIVSEFFHVFEKQLVNQDRIEKLLIKYSDLLVSTQSTDFGKGIVQYVLEDKTSIHDLKEKICKKLQKSKAYYAFVIDDIDRLESEEIVEVMRLIRVSANFCHVLFVAAFDKAYVIKSLTDGGIQNAENYLQKIFDVEVPLLRPNVSQLLNMFALELKTKMNNWERLRLEIYRIMKTPTSTGDYVLAKYVQTFRDAERLANQFALEVNHIQNNGNLAEYNLPDLFWLTVLRLNNNELFAKLETDPLSILSKKTIGGKMRFEYNKTDEEEKNELLALLFASTFVNYTSIVYVHNYPKYFALHVANNYVSYLELVSIISNIDSEETHLELRNIMNSLSRKDSFFDSLYLYPSKDEERLSYIKTILFSTPYMTNHQIKQFYDMIQYADGIIGKQFVTLFKEIIDAYGPYMCWNYAITTMIPRDEEYEFYDEEDFPYRCMTNEEMNDVLKYNFNKYIELYNPSYDSITDYGSPMNQFIQSISYCSRSSKDGDEYFNPIVDELGVCFGKEKKTFDDFQKFMNNLTDGVPDDGEDYLIQRIERLFGSRNSIHEFILTTVENSVELDKYLESMRMYI